MPTQLTKSRFARASRLGAVGARASLSRAWAGLKGVGRSEDVRVEQLEAHHRAAAEQLKAALGSMKGLATKLGQLASFVDTGMGDPRFAHIYQEVLAELRAQTPTMPFAEVSRVIEADHGAPTSELFAEFEEQPFAGASIGQVHRAQLLDGRRVVVKVQYPGVDEAVESDLRNARSLSFALPLFAPGLDGPALLEEAERALREELDYEAEARHQLAFADLYRGHPFIRVPEPHMDLCGGRTLVVEEVRGKSFEELLDASQQERDRAAEILFRFAFGTLFRKGFFNADTHPGNYAFDGQHVVFYDFGAVKRVPEVEFIEFINMTRSLMYGDVMALYEDCCATGFVPKPEKVQPQRLYDYLHMSAGQLISKEGPITVTPEWVGEVVEATANPTGEWYDLLRHINLHPESLLIGRMQLGIMAVLARLNATGPWGDIAREWVLEREPSTALGEADAAFFRD